MSVFIFLTYSFISAVGVYIAIFSAKFFLSSLACLTTSSSFKLHLVTNSLVKTFYLSRASTYFLCKISMFFLSRSSLSSASLLTSLNFFTTFSDRVLDSLQIVMIKFSVFEKVFLIVSKASVIGIGMLFHFSVFNSEFKK